MTRRQAATSDRLAAARGTCLGDFRRRWRRQVAAVRGGAVELMRREQFLGERGNLAPYSFIHLCLLLFEADGGLCAPGRAFVCHCKEKTKRKGAASWKEKEGRQFGGHCCVGNAEVARGARERRFWVGPHELEREATWPRASQRQGQLAGSPGRGAMGATAAALSRGRPKDKRGGGGKSYCGPECAGEAPRAAGRWELPPSVRRRWRARIQIKCRSN